MAPLCRRVYNKTKHNYFYAKCILFWPKNINLFSKNSVTLKIALKLKIIFNYYSYVISSIIGSKT